MIDSAPATAGYGQNVAIASAQASTIAKVGLVRLGAPTHSEDQGQRYVPLSFSVSGTTITATSPATSNIAPAGYYMLFVTDTAGVPSVAKIVKLERGAVTPPPSAGTPIVGIGGRCIDIRGGAAVNRADLLMNTCDGRAERELALLDQRQVAALARQVHGDRRQRAQVGRAGPAGSLHRHSAQAGTAGRPTGPSAPPLASASSRRRARRRFCDAGDRHLQDGISRPTVELVRRTSSELASAGSAPVRCRCGGSAARGPGSPAVRDEHVPGRRKGGSGSPQD